MSAMTPAQWKEYHRIHERPISQADIDEVNKLYRDGTLSLVDLARKVKRQPKTVLAMLAAKGRVENITSAAKPRPSSIPRGTSSCGD